MRAVVVLLVGGVGGAGGGGAGAGWRWWSWWWRVCYCRAGFIDTQTCYPNGNPLICPSMKGSGVDLYQYSETLLRASRLQSGMRWAVEAAFSRAKLDRWMNCPVRRAVVHHAEDMIMTSMLNSLWYLPFAKPADWSSVDEAVQSQYSGQSAHKCPTLLIDYFSQKIGPR